MPKLLGNKFFKRRIIILKQYLFWFLPRRREIVFVNLMLMSTEKICVTLQEQQHKCGCKQDILPCRHYLLAVYQVFSDTWDVWHYKPNKWMSTEDINMKGQQPSKTCKLSNSLYSLYMTNSFLIIFVYLSANLNSPTVSLYKYTTFLLPCI